MLGTNYVNVTLETKGGNVSLCSNELGIHLCYPLGVNISKNFVKDIFGEDKDIIKYNEAKVMITRVIEEGKRLSKVILVGGKRNNSISAFFTKETDKELYECFVCLLHKIGNFLGGIKAINVHSNKFNYTPQKLADEEYNLTEIHRFNEVLYYANKQNKEIILSEIYNEDKWMTVIRYKVSDDVGASKIAELLSENL